MSHDALHCVILSASEGSDGIQPDSALPPSKPAAPQPEISMFFNYGLSGCHPECQRGIE